MKLQSIQVANNGFVLETMHGELYIAKTMIEAAQLVGEITPTTTTAVYATDKSIHEFTEVKTLAKRGYKVEAIKKMRDCFTPKLGLREAKDLVESLCG
jgi:ribosomal protein L7/L12